MKAEILESHAEAKYGKSFLKLTAETDKEKKFLRHMSFCFAQRCVDNADELNIFTAENLVIGTRFEFKSH